MNIKSQKPILMPQPSHPGEPASRSDARSTAGMLALELLHQVTNPLEILGHLIYLAGQKSGDPEQVCRYMQMAEAHIATLSRIAGQTLYFAEIPEGYEQIDLVDLAETALRLHQGKIEAKQIHLVRDLPSGFLTGVHHAQMLHVISSLIVNALESLHQEGTLSLRLRRRRDGLHLVVADNGCGIASEHMDRIFEPCSTTHRKRGAGISLALTRQIVQDHRGTLSLRTSTRAGRTGTAFKIYLPSAK